MSRQRATAPGVEIVISRVHSGEVSVVMRPKLFKPDGTWPFAVVAMGAHVGAVQALTFQTLFALAQRGVLVIASDLGDVSSANFKGDGPGKFGNDTQVTMIADVETYAINTLGCDPARMALVGVSQGGAVVERRAAQQPSRLKCVLQAIPLTSVQDYLNYAVVSDTTTAGQIRTAWGIAGDTVPVGATGIEAAPSIKVPVLSYYSTNDPWARPTPHAAFVAAMSPSLIDARSLGAVAHQFSSVPTDEAADWVLARL